MTPERLHELEDLCIRLTGRFPPGRSIPRATVANLRVSAQQFWRWAASRLDAELAEARTQIALLRNQIRTAPGMLEDDEEG